MCRLVVDVGPRAHCGARRVQRDLAAGTGSSVKEDTGSGRGANARDGNAMVAHFAQIFRRLIVGASRPSACTCRRVGRSCSTVERDDGVGCLRYLTRRAQQGRFGEGLKRHLNFHLGTAPGGIHARVARRWCSDFSRSSVVALLSPSLQLQTPQLRFAPTRGSLSGTRKQNLHCTAKPSKVDDPTSDIPDTRRSVPCDTPTRHIRKIPFPSTHPSIQSILRAHNPTTQGMRYDLFRK